MFKVKDVIDVDLVPLLLALNIFHTFPAPIPKNKTKKPTLTKMSYIFPFFFLRGDSQIEKSVPNVDPTFEGGGGILLRRLDFTSKTSKIIEF